MHAQRVEALPYTLLSLNFIVSLGRHCLVFEKEGGRFLWALIYDKLVVLQASALSRFVERKPCRPPFVQGPLRQCFLRECSPREVDITILVITTIVLDSIRW